ncbi:LysR family transcriptional regulator [Amycolatopsis thermophila]|uniref:DNA-binding transcriptional LysR family regulator n=1 Tax=Amycolatopsis thermophila TaxID=206084 RepID=A0ABU0EZI1_9PSEU|nr:LysR family transcriptional regulator [Amycolatopsis thermophila]MDQ0380719.1 DNA-binding transcriptional LysR family regulator [Amycolatopsis thermophila]
MELRQLSYFVAVAEELSFTRASQRLRIVQSAVSTAIRALEKEVGAELFDRDSRRVALTAAGEAMLPGARATLAAARAAAQAASGASGEVRGVVTMGTLLSSGRVDVPRVLGRFSRRHPRAAVRLQYSPSGSAGHVRAVLDGRMDLALASVSGRAPAGLAHEVVSKEDLRLLCGPDHALARRAEVTLADLAEESFVDFPLGWGNRTLVDRAFAGAGLTRSVPLEVSDYATARSLICQGLGVGFVPAGAADGMAGVVEVPLVPEPLRWSVSLVHSAVRPLSPAAAALLREIHAELD